MSREFFYQIYKRHHLKNLKFFKFRNFDLKKIKKIFEKKKDEKIVFFSKACLHCAHFKQYVSFNHYI